MNDSRRRLKSLLAPALIGAGYFLFSLATLSRQYTFDAISYLLDVERTDLSLPLRAERIAYNFFHSQHLLFSFFVYLFYHAWTLAGYAGSALLPAQILNLLEGSVGLALVFAILRDITGDVTLSVLFSCLLGCSFAFWDNTAMVSDHMASCLMALLLFQALRKTPIEGASPARIGFLGFLNGLAFLMHQVNGLLGVMFLAALWSGGFRLKSLGIYLLAALLTAGVPYLLVGALLLGNSSPHDFLFWSFYYAMPGVIDVAGHYGTVGAGKIVELFSGFGASVVGGFYWMNRVFEVRPLQRYGVPLLGGLGALLFVFIVVRSRLGRGDRKAGPDHRKSLQLAASWFVAYALLLYWWWPSYYQLWAVPLSAFVLFAGTWLHVNVGAPLIRRRALGTALAGVVLLVASANALSAFYPSHQIGNNDYYMTTREIGRRSSPGDLVVVPGDDEYEIYIPFFARRSAVSLHASLVEHLNALDESFEELETAMNGAWEGGHRVFIVSELRDSAVAYRDLYDLHHLSSEAVSRKFRRYAVLDTVTAGTLTLYKLRNPEEGE
ncbi:MAG TPA: hypothetical protein VI215_00695 [Bacteroidota bacterium]|jgi:hypothetical protein